MRVPLVLIAAVGRNGAIGRAGALPWRLPSDLRHFRRETMGKPVILGRRTWQSIGRPLPGRILLVVSSDAGLALPDGVLRCADPAEALARGRALARASGAEAVMGAGGAKLYAALMGAAARLIVTEVDLAPEADALFPPIAPDTWREVSRAIPARDPDDEAGTAIVRYERR